MKRISAAVFALVALAACSPKKDKETQSADKPTVGVVQAVSAPGSGALRASGLVAYQREPSLSFRVPGVIDRIAVDEGDVVRAGQRLAWLRPTEVAAGAAQAESALEVARRNLERTQTLFDKGLVAQARLDDARLALDRAKAGADQAGFNRDTAVIVAPADGIILRRLAEPAQVAAAGAPILALGEVGSGLLVKAAFASGDASRVKVGMPAKVAIRDVGPAELDGSVSRIAGKGDSATGAFDVEIALKAPKGIRSGMVAEVLLAAPEGATRASAVNIPASALLDARADQGSVFVVDTANIARRRAVRTSGVSGADVTIIAGLAPGEAVISQGAAYVADGAAVVVAQPAR
jgi:RND family efflux transporter MFP subunit